MNLRFDMEINGMDWSIYCEVNMDDNEPSGFEISHLRATIEGKEYDEMDLLETQIETIHTEAIWRFNNLNSN